MDELPVGVLGAVPADARPAVAQWWAQLNDTDRRQLRDSWDTRQESYFFTRQAGDSWARVPVVNGGRFVPHDDSVRMHEWLEDWQEYVLGHEDVILIPWGLAVMRTFHICQAHPAARAAVDAGRLPANFQCPFGAASCPMRRLQAVALSHPIHLTPAAAGGWWVVTRWEG